MTALWGPAFMDAFMSVYETGRPFMIAAFMVVRWALPTVGHRLTDWVPQDSLCLLRGFSPQLLCSGVESGSRLPGLLGHPLLNINTPHTSLIRRRAVPQVALVCWCAAEVSAAKRGRSPPESSQEGDWTQ